MPPPAMSVTYATVGGRLVREVRNSVITRYVSDTLGSVVQTRNSAGTQTSSTEFWPFGEVWTSSGTNPSPWGFVGTLGYYADLASRLYVRARYYRTSLSRWMTVDSLWPDEAAYSYAHLMPVKLVDPTGFSPASDFERCFRNLHKWPRRISRRERCRACKRAYNTRHNCDGQFFDEPQWPAPAPAAPKAPTCSPGAGIVIPPGSSQYPGYPYGNIAWKGSKSACMAACREAMKGVVASKWITKLCEEYCFKLTSGGCKKLFERCLALKGTAQKESCMVMYYAACPDGGQT